MFICLPGLNDISFSPTEKWEVPKSGANSGQNPTFLLLNSGIYSEKAFSSQELANPYLLKRLSFVNHFISVTGKKMKLKKKNINIHCLKKTNYLKGMSTMLHVYCTVLH